MILATYLFEWEIKSFAETPNVRSLSLETCEELQASVMGGLLDFINEDKNPNRVSFWFYELTNSLNVQRNKSEKTGNPVWQIGFQLTVHHGKGTSFEAIPCKVKMYLRRFETARIWGIARQVEPSLSFLVSEYKIV